MPESMGHKGARDPAIGATGSVMQIRPATQSDAAAIAEIWNDLIANTTITFTTIAKTQADISAEIDAKNGAFWVADQAGTVLGFATYGPFRSGPGYARTMEHSVHLVPAARGQGAGRALMHKVETHAVQNGVHALIAGVGGENAPGIAFHLALGYRQLAVLPEVGRKFDRWQDLVLLQKLLKPVA